ncbi:isoprenylcysteine carboxylmethyltransferase family protein [Terrabacter aerolatus]|uniref:Membrane protein n=1 Tax=Terrabacter aerolatus TaxID=422442 RepID=A0A512D348_9MICO|nr:NnrU family protein [Terrabacter aerolatus]GEO30895.1 membrane protein [Terrabacter aerolatus]
MTRRIAFLIVSAVAWCGFVAVTAWTTAFLAGVGLPRTVDGPARSSTGWAVTVDLALLLLFAVQHSVMARRPVKAWLRRRVPAELERTTYVLATDACLALLLALWQPWDQRVWQVEGVTAYALWSLCAAGWVLAIAATFAVDHLELIGLRQAGWGSHATTGADTSPPLRVGGLHAVVRHPLMTGLVVAFWATPRMSAPHLLFAVAATAYVIVGITFEERDLRRTFGQDYEAYAARVPALVPGLRLRLQRGVVAGTGTSARRARP